MTPELFVSWKRSVPRLEDVIRRMEEKLIVAVGSTPYSRVIPSFFLRRRKYQIYCWRDAGDLDPLLRYVDIDCMEKKHPEVAAKVRATIYVLRNSIFKRFLRRRLVSRNLVRLMFYQMNPPIVQALEEMKIEWIGNRPERFGNLLFKAHFRDVVKALQLPRLDDRRFSRDEFLAKTFEDLHQYWERPVVAQRADEDEGRESRTFFIRTEADYHAAHDILSNDLGFKEVLVSPYVEGLSVSMLGCVTHLGVLTSTLQLQLIDIPEALNGQLPTGVFFGHDWGFRSWDDKTEKVAQNVTESVGKILSEKGYKGIFGIDFIYDPRAGAIFPLECNPRFTGALPVYSLMILSSKEVPPLEFFHIMAQLGIDESFDFDFVNEKLKERRPVSHISLTLRRMNGNEIKNSFKSGVYSYSHEDELLTYERPDLFPWELTGKSEFIVTSSIPRDNVPQIQIIFPHSIAQSSNVIDPKVGQLLNCLLRLEKHQD